MNKKIVGIFVMMLMIGTAVLPVLGNINIAGMNPDDELDQSQEVYSMLVPIHGGWGRSYAQSFVPNLDILTRVELGLYVSQSWDVDNKDLKVSIRSDLQSGNDLTFVSKLRDKFLENEEYWCEFDFQDIKVNPGETYYIVCKTEGGNDSNKYTLQVDTISDGNSYQNGDLWQWRPFSDWEKYKSPISEALVDACFKTYGIANQAPNNPACSYDRRNDELVVTATDPDDDQIRYGVDWNDDLTIDQWTSLVPSGSEQRIDCGGRKGTVGVIAEDEHGAQSDWESIRSKTKAINTPFLTFLENHPHLFPLIRQILGL